MKLKTQKYFMKISFAPASVDHLTFSQKNK